MAETRYQPYGAIDLTGQTRKETGLVFSHPEGMALSLYAALRAKGIVSHLRFNKTTEQWMIESDPAYAEDTRTLFLGLLSQERK